MSEKRYVIVSASHHKKPRAFFLSEPLEGKTTPTWRNCIESSLLFTLEQAKKAADGTPIGCYIVEHNENLRMWLSEKEGIKFATLVEIAIDEDCEVIGDLPQSKQPETQAKETPEEKREYVIYRYLSEGSDVKQFYPAENNPFCQIGLAITAVYTEDEAMLQVNKLARDGSKGWFCVHRDAFNADGSFKDAERETPKPKADSESKELSEGYIVYTQSAYQTAYIYYCGDDAKHLDERNIKNAALFPYITAVEVAKKLAVSSEYSGYTWRVKNKINAAKEETPAPEAKKRVGYVLYHSTQRQERIYAHYESNGVFVRVAGIVADAYRTPEDAQFAADVLNNNGDTNFGWKVEQIEF